MEANIAKAADLKRKKLGIIRISSASDLNDRFVKAALMWQPTSIKDRIAARCMFYP
jgi:hypothetical protein